MSFSLEPIFDIKTWYGTQAFGRTPFFERLCPRMTKGLCEPSAGVTTERYFASATIISAPLAEIIAVGVLVLPEVMVGITEASATRKPSMP